MHLLTPFECVTAGKEDKRVKGDPWGPAFQKYFWRLGVGWRDAQSLDALKEMGDITWYE